MSRSEDWQNWLKETDSELYQMLIDVINQRKGCSSNSEVMMKIYKGLYDRGLGEEFEVFITKRYSWIIEKSTTGIKRPPRRLQDAPKMWKKQRKVSDVSSMNKHKVFRSYRPDLLQFPHKYIIVNDPSKICQEVEDFVRDKIGVDWIIIEDHAYIEYFPAQYADICEQISPETRDVHCYRMRQAQEEENAPHAR